MSKIKTVGAIWFVLFLALSSVAVPDLVGSVVDQNRGVLTGFHDPGWWLFQFVAVGFIVWGAVCGIGLYRYRRWAATSIRIMAPLLVLFCPTLLFMGDGMLVIVVPMLAISVYSSIVVWRWAPSSSSIP